MARPLPHPPPLAGQSVAATAGPAAHEEIDFEALQEAAEWFATLRAGNVADDDWQAWQQWRAARTVNELAWQRVERIAGKFERVPDAMRADAHHALNVAKGRQQARRRTLGALSVLGVSALAGMLGWRVAPWQVWAADYRTGTGERREIRLADGTHVWLNTNTAIDVDYGATLRQVLMRRGEILVTTAHDTVSPRREFVVDTAQGRLRALGTRFTVRQLDDATELSVFEGAVEVRLADGNGAPRVVDAGSQVRFTDREIEAAAPVDLWRESWTTGMLLAENMRLGDFVAELSRYRPGHLGCSPAVADLRLVGAYSLRDTDRVLRALEDTLPVKIVHTLPWWTVVQPRRS